MTRHDFDNSGDSSPALLPPLAGPLHDRPRVSESADARAMLAAAVLGMDLGEYDRRVLAYLASDDTAAAIASIIHRARQEDPR